MVSKTAFVTGSDRGLGFALVQVLLGRGYKVFAGSYMPEWGDLVKLTHEHQGNLHILPLDVTDEESVKKAAASIQAKVDHLDLVINNAGIFKDSSGDILGELNFDDMRRLYETNTLGPLRVTNSIIHLLTVGTQKLLVNISSEAGSISDCWRKSEFGYSMSKTAVNMQSAILQNHLKEYGVKVLAFHPGYVRSYMLGQLNTEATVEPIDSAEGIIEQTLKAHSLDGPIYLDYQGNQIEW